MEMVLKIGLSGISYIIFQPGSITTSSPATGTFPLVQASAFDQNLSKFSGSTSVGSLGH